VSFWHTERNQLVEHWWQYTKSIRVIEWKELNIGETSGCRVVGAGSFVTTAASQTHVLVGCWCILGDWHTTMRVCLLLQEHGTSWSHLLIHRTATATDCQCSQLWVCQVLLLSSCIRIISSCKHIILIFPNWEILQCYVSHTAVSILIFWSSVVRLFLCQRIWEIDLQCRPSTADLG
jgi:hypothetical protein